MNDKTLEELRYYFTGYGSPHDETILKLIEENKRYREVIKKAIDDLENECLLNYVPNYQCKLRTSVSKGEIMPEPMRKCNKKIREHT